MSNNNDWKNQYQTYEQAQNMNNFFQFQQNMFENMMKMTEKNQLLFKEEQIIILITILLINHNLKMNI